MEFFDTHAHYDDDRFNQDREQVINKIYDAGVTKCVNIGCDIKTSKQAIEIANEHVFIYATCGIHPSEIPQNEKQLWKDIDQIKELILSNSKVVAIRRDWVRLSL